MEQFKIITAWVQARLNLEDERGAGMVEYALLVALIGVALIIALGSLQGGIEDTLGSAESQL